jgi:hypothetical protein
MSETKFYTHTEPRLGPNIFIIKTLCLRIMNFSSFFFTLTSIFQIKNRPGNIYSIRIKLITFVKRKFILQLVIETISYYYIDFTIWLVISSDFIRWSTTEIFSHLNDIIRLRSCVRQFKRLVICGALSWTCVCHFKPRPSEKRTAYPKVILSTNVQRKTEFFNYSENWNSLGWETDLAQKHNRTEFNEKTTQQSFALVSVQ